MTIKTGLTLTTSLILLHPCEPRILCIHHPTFGRWMFPGGRVETGETPQQAILREVEEEVGLEVRLCDLSPLPAWDDGRNRRLPLPFAVIQEEIPASDDGSQLLDFVFVGVSSNDRFRLDAEVLRAAWCERSEVAELGTTYPIHELADAALNDEARIRTAVCSPQSRSS